MNGRYPAHGQPLLNIIAPSILHTLPGHSFFDHVENTIDTQEVCLEKLLGICKRFFFN